MAQPNNTQEKSTQNEQELAEPQQLTKHDSYHQMISVMNHNNTNNKKMTLLSKYTHRERPMTVLQN